ncbi:MAG: hypothetical protein V4543_06695 [Bacteroidota bacterium]
MHQRYVFSLLLILGIAFTSGAQNTISSRSSVPWYRRINPVAHVRALFSPGKTYLNFLPSEQDYVMRVPLPRHWLCINATQLIVGDNVLTYEHMMGNSRNALMLSFGNKPYLGRTYTELGKGSYFMADELAVYRNLAGSYYGAIGVRRYTGLGFRADAPFSFTAQAYIRKVSFETTTIHNIGNSVEDTYNYTMEYNAVIYGLKLQAEFRLLAKIQDEYGLFADFYAGISPRWRYTHRITQAVPIPGDTEAGLRKNPWSLQPDADHYGSLLLAPQLGIRAGIWIR